MRSNTYLTEHTTSHDDIDYNDTVDDEGHQVLRRWWPYGMEETEAVFCKVHRTVDQGIGTIVSRDHYGTSLHALRSLSRSMFGAWFALRNATSLHPIAPYTVEVTKEKNTSVSSWISWRITITKHFAVG